MPRRTPYTDALFSWHLPKMGRLQTAVRFRSGFCSRNELQKPGMDKINIPQDGQRRKSKLKMPSKIENAVEKLLLLSQVYAFIAQTVRKCTNQTFHAAIHDWRGFVSSIGNVTLQSPSTSSEQVPEPSPELHKIPPENHCPKALIPAGLFTSFEIA